MFFRNENTFHLTYLKDLHLYVSMENLAIMSNM